ncbi:MAG: NAD(P)/FAD-dependent oxidoreductase [Candidatus Hodarchaeota archaeon]
MAYDYDVVIVGAGPAGLSTADSVAKSGLSCLVVEKNQKVGHPVRTSGATWLDEMSELGIPRKYLHPISRVSIIGPHEEVSVEFDETNACVMDVSRAYQFLASQAQKSGVELKLGAKVKDILIEGGLVKGVKLEGDDELDYIKCRVTVDASGFNAVLLKKLGIIEDWERKAVGVQYNVLSSNLDHQQVLLFVGERFAPCGYGWFFPWKRSEVRIGVGVIRPDCRANPDQFAQRLVGSEYVSRLMNDYRVLEKEVGIFSCSGPLKNALANGFLAVGDAAGLGSPLHGEGIRYAIKFGRKAGDIISRAIVEGDVSKRNLRSFEKMWRKTEERNFRIGLSIQKRVSLYTDEQWDKGLRYLGDIAERDRQLFIQMFKSNFSYRNIWRVFRNSPVRALKVLLRSL